MSKRIKAMQITEIRNRIGESRDLLVINSAKLDGVSANRFRLALREKSISALAVPNSLARKALNDVDLTTLDSLLEGPSTLVWGGEDIVGLSKEIAKWAAELKEIEIKGGTFEGKTLSAGDVETLSKSPSREELIGQIAGMILGPGAQLAAAILGPGETIAGQVKSIAEKDDS